MKITKKPSQFLYKSNKWSVNTHWDSHTFEKLERQIFRRRKIRKEREQKPTNANIFKKTKTKSSESNEGNINKNKNYTSIKNEQTQKLCHPHFSTKLTYTNMQKDVRRRILFLLCVVITTHICVILNVIQIYM